jgi:Ran GTPase-activating protein (RanGAP) involved in mRNA processing and transport
MRKLNLEFNEIGVKGVEHIAEGLSKCSQLVYLNLKGNGIRDEGLQMLS